MSAAFVQQYYPTLCIRRAEMKAMEKLPPSEKQKMLPIVLLAPWLNSIEFARTFERIEISIGDFPIIADLDRDYQSDSIHPSRTYFWSLLRGADAHERWIDLIKAHDNYIPVVQNYGNDHAIQRQIDEFSALNRGYAFRIQVERDGEIDFVSRWLNATNMDRQLVIMDGGWKDYSVEQERLFYRKIKKLVDTFPNVRFVITTSNFPNDFTDLDNMNSITIDSRILYRNLQRSFGNYQMFYGDWASTKPRRYDGFGSKPLDRIDFPTKSSWIIARSKEQEWDFVDAAKRVTRLPEWEDKPNVWGAKLIEKTARNLPGAITTGPQAIAARINIHLFLQNNFTADVHRIPTTAEWVDPI